MRGLFYALSAMFVMALAYWAYSENYRTQDALRKASALQREIGAARETLAVLQAEWAYLNRPERLRELAELNFAELQLLPITPEQFSSVTQVAYPAPDPVLEELIASVNVSAQLESGRAVIASEAGQ